ncbi:MAG: 7-carboxy-7-deazaguanine synthase, partial [Candidatus Neomarinimicrobiota bacterium]
FKTPSSGMMKHNRWSILDDLAPHDEIKFVIGDRKDYDWAKKQIEAHQLNERHTILLAPVYGEMESQTLAEWLLTEPPAGDPVRFQIQLHKAIWGPHRRGV